MDAPLLSNWWYRVADRKPKLRSHARLYRHRYRGEVWYLLQDPASTRVHRFTPAARLIIALMDGERSVAQLWEIANKHLGEDAPSQDDIIQLLGQLHAADLLQSDVTPDVAELFTRGERQDRVRNLQSFANPMAIRLPLWDPDKFLNHFKGLLRLIWGRWGALVGHHTRLGAGVVLNPGANVGGNASVGNGAVLGMGAIVVNGVEVGAQALVAAGAVVVRTVEPATRVQGVPARVFVPA